MEHCLDYIDRMSLNEIRCEANPASIVRFTLDGIAICFRLKLKPIELVPHLKITRETTCLFGRTASKRAAGTSLDPVST